MTRQTGKIRIFVDYYLPVIIWMFLIFYLSSIPGLRSGSSSILVELFLRKSAHLLEYCIFTLLLWRIFYYQLKFSLLKAGLLAIFICFLYSISDEFHQIFVQDRVGQLIDVLIDSIGIIFGFLFGIFISRIKIRK